MTAKKQPLYDPSALYEVKLSRPAPVGKGRRVLLPGERHEMTGAVLEKIAGNVESARKL